MSLLTHFTEIGMKEKIRLFDGVITLVNHGDVTY